MYTHLFLITLLTPCCVHNHYGRFNDECKHVCYCYHSLHNAVCQTTMSDVTMNVHTCLSENTTTPWCMADDSAWFNDECTNMYCYRIHVRSLCHIYWLMNTHVLLKPLLTQCCMYDSTINVDTYFTDITTMLNVRSLRESQW